MTVRKAIAKAKENSNLRGVCKDTYYIGGILMTTALSFRDESVAREIANQAVTASLYAGVSMSVEDINTQEKWERILAQLQTQDVVVKGEHYSYNLIP